MRPEYDFLFVGAGLTNCVLAHRALNELGAKCLIVDKRGEIGGNCATKRILGITVHEYGAHIFHTSDENVWKFVNRFSKFKPYVNSPLARFDGSHVYNLPFNLHTFMQLWPNEVTDSESAKRKLESERVKIAAPKNLEEQALALVGRTIYEKLIRGYTEKQWGRPCSELPPEIIKRIPVRFEYDDNYFTDKYQGIPFDGYSKMMERMTEGADFLFNFDFSTSRNRHLVEGMCKKIYHSGAIDEFYNYRYGPLGYRSLRFDREIHPVESWQKVAVQNHTNSNVPWTRTIEHKKFLDETNSHTVVDTEYPEAYIPGKNEPMYPISTSGCLEIYGKYVSIVNEKVKFAGRLGTYKYMDMDDCVKAALSERMEMPE